MVFTEQSLPGVYAIEVEPSADERGVFARTYDSEEYAAHGLDPGIAQQSTSWNPRAGTLRGMHFQQPPHAETKVVRCTRGAVYAVAIDLRRESASHCGWTTLELRADDRRAIYVPKGMAFGFQTIEDACELLYQMSVPFVPSHYAGVRWDDPAFGVTWPERPRVISDRDAAYPDYRP